MPRKPKTRLTPREVVDRACAEYAERKRQEGIKAQAIQAWIMHVTEAVRVAYNTGLTVPAAVASITGQGGGQAN